MWDNLDGLEAEEGRTVVILVPILSLLVGLSAALAAKEQNRRVGSVMREPYLMGVVFFSGLLLLPLTAYVMIIHPAWSMIYLIDPANMSAFLLVAFLVGTLALGAGGYLLGHVLCRRKFDAVLIGLVVLLVGGLAALFVLAGDRLGRLTEDLVFEKAPALLSSRLAAVFAFALPVVLGGWIFLLAFYAVEGRKMRRAIFPVLPKGFDAEGSKSSTSSYPLGLGSFERFIPLDSVAAASQPQAPSGPPPAPKAPVPEAGGPGNANGSSAEKS